MALSGNTVFVTYLLISDYGGGGFNSNYIHCNYISSVQVSDADLSSAKLNITFPNINDFKFLTVDATTGTGFTCSEIYSLIQIVPNSGFTSLSEVKANPAQWRGYDLTSQIIGYSGVNLSAVDLVNTIFVIPLSLYYTDMFIYPLDVLITYMNKFEATGSDLSFGDEYFFLGNVTTKIKATAYTTEIPIVLSPQEYNTSTNSTWKSMLDGSVVISEIGIYDQNKNLVGIGKLNDPIVKNLNSEGTIVFAIDF
jgi:hypothetical protein